MTLVEAIRSTSAAPAAPALLREFNDAGVLAAADVHVAEGSAELAGEQDERVLLAAALAVRAPRIGHVHVDLATIRDTATVDTEEPIDLSQLPWPEPGRLGRARGRERPRRRRRGSRTRRAARSASSAPGSTSTATGGRSGSRRRPARRQRAGAAGRLAAAC